ncbi:MAG: metal ABC transporter substrate-binding protein [Candidatus Omnitrophica bacterium]|nr:metal ABC transporter substrate-binding protein [Candidatus Omnitrophota bacterium]
MGRSIGIICALLIMWPGEICASEIKNINVLTSFYPAYIMAINVCKDVPGVTVTNLTPSTGGCLHDYSITTNDMKKLSDADIFIACGAGMEPFIDKVARRYPAMKIATLSDGIQLIAGKGEKPANGHLWVSITNAISQVRNLGRAMATFDPAHKNLYRVNTDAYTAKLDNLRSRMRSELAPFKGAKIVTFHEAFSYFTREFDLEIAAVVEREPGSEPSAKELAETIDLIKKSGIKSLFSEPQYPAIAANTIAKETGAVVYVLDPAVTGPDDPDAYLKIMETNLSVLKRAL